MEAGGRRWRAALLALALLLPLLLLTLPPPALRASSALPPGLLEELRQRRRDLRRLAAGGVEAEGGLRCGDVRREAGGEVLGSGFAKVVVRAALVVDGAVALKSVHGAVRAAVRGARRLPPSGRVQAAEGGDAAATSAASRHRAGTEGAEGACRGVRGDGAADGRSSLQLHGQCYDGGGEPEAGVTAVLELGAPLEMIQLLQTPWEERFKICLGLVELLFYLAHSPLGSIVLLDFQPRQFVMVDGNLKVTDMDDASTEEPSCEEDNDCTLEFPTKSFPLQCSSAGKCKGINEKRNLFNAYRYFFTYLLPHSAPPTLQPLLSDILNATGNLRYGINETLRAFEKVLHLYKSGLYLQKRPLLLKDYISLRGFRTEEAEAYKCWPSYSHLGCLLSVHSPEEAAAICSSQPKCQSFIITQQRTWTGELGMGLDSSCYMVPRCPWLLSSSIVPCLAKAVIMGMKVDLGEGVGMVLPGVLCCFAFTSPNITSDICSVVLHIIKM
ncbi:hypothetical protein ASZ78_003868 [Callipepla squamata]|uniref:FAM69 protein-kinase domain-containing protein n=1 Tax=Callipepla squamata TaxID=9009 RepID=A0A226N594_CALSU|nr:hypothetical protein ASZ78_003868 [Callipepla squamata]